MGTQNGQCIAVLVPSQISNEQTHQEISIKTTCKIRSHAQRRASGSWICAIGAVESSGLAIESHVTVTVPWLAAASIFIGALSFE